MSQDKNFDLSKYKFPDYKRHLLEFNFNSNGNSSSWSDIYKQSNNTSGFNLSYNFVKSTRKRVESLSSTLNTSYDFSKSVNESDKITNKYISGYFSIDASERYYLTEDKWFLEIDPGFYSNIGRNTSDGTSTGKLKSSTNYFGIELGLGAGIGRIENVTEFWQAYYILEGMKKQGLLSRQTSSDDVSQLATLSSQLKSKRFFDSRLKKIDEMKSLDSLMHVTGLVENSDISYFNTINDYWNFANIPTRQSGKLLKLLVTPLVSRNFYNLSNGEKHTTNTTSLRTALDFQCHKQMNLFWERFFYLNLSNNTTIDSDENIVYKYPKNFLRVNSNAGFDYYPNFRTQVRASVNYLVYQYMDELNEANTAYLKSWSNNLSLNCNVYYYISPQLRIEGIVGANYADQISGSSQKDKVYLSYNLGFRYAIF
jgi:hypothetical protein